MARHHRKGKRFLGFIKSKGADKFIWFGTLIAVAGAAYFILSGRKTGVAPLDVSLQSIGTTTHLEGAGGKIPVLGGFFPSGAHPTSGGASQPTGAPKMTPTSAASADGADRFTNFSQAYFARGYAGRKTNDITDRISLS